MNRHFYNSIKYSLIIWAVSVTLVHAQGNKISGVITDADSGEPIPFANVFFASTSIGISSDMAGKFVLQNFPDGKYDFTVAYVGYTSFQQAFEFNSSEYRLEVRLKTEEVRLREVTIKADTNGWASNFLIFKRTFLGVTANASHCTILNPRDIHLYFDKDARILVAHASKPIMVENKALGYTIHWYLQKFELNYRVSRLEIFGIPSFHELTPRHKRQLERWKKERKRAYFGSVQHFMSTLLRNTWREEDFEARIVNLIPNPERPTKEFLDAKMAALKADITSPGDSLAYYSQLATKPEWVEKVSDALASTPEIINRESQTLKKQTLAIRYKGEREEVDYPPTVGRTTRKDQDSVIRILGSVKIYPNGYYEPIENLLIEKYWAWSEKISDMLPLDYSPVSSNK